MKTGRRSASDIAFTPTVKAIQARKGSREHCARMQGRDGWSNAITPALAAFIAGQTSVFLATVSATGHPYIQHRGGPAGFLRVLDERTIGLADFRGNRQYITQGNLADNPKAHLFLIDYVARQRVKIWGRACVIEDDPRLLDTLTPAHYKARPEQAIVFRIEAWDVNCPQHIPQRFEAKDVAAIIESRDRRIAELEAELARLNGLASA